MRGRVYPGLFMLRINKYFMGPAAGTGMRLPLRRTLVRSVILFTTCHGSLFPEKQKVCCLNGHIANTPMHLPVTLNLCFACRLY